MKPDSERSMARDAMKKYTKAEKCEIIDYTII